jgi:hypothetical protein
MMGDRNSQLLTNIQTRMSEPLEVRSETVGIIACDSTTFAGKAFSGAKNIIGVESGSGTSPTTSSQALSHAGFAAAQQLIQGKGPTIPKWVRTSK